LEEYALQSCASVNQSKFTGEIGIHFPGLKNIDKLVVRIFPELIVCLDGAAEFLVPAEGLQEALKILEASEGSISAESLKLILKRGLFRFGTTSGR
jgi:hypothetical protein